MVIMRLTILLLLLFSYSGYSQECIYLVPPPNPNQEGVKTISPKAGSGRCVEIYVETDYWTFVELGASVTLVKRWIGDMFENIKYIYGLQDIHVVLKDTYVPQFPSWADTIASRIELLYKFGEVRGDAYDGKLAHFITGRALGGGIAWIGTYNTNSFWATLPDGRVVRVGPYAISANMEIPNPTYPQYGWNAYVFSHEMGHTLGSHHTQDCVWGVAGDQIIDDCVKNPNTEVPCDLVMPVQYSTIMSYCHLTGYGIDFQVGLGDLPGARIQNNVETSSRLICSSPCNTPQSLTGDITGVYFADEITITNAELLPVTILNPCN